MNLCKFRVFIAVAIFSCFGLFHAAHAAPANDFYNEVVELTCSEFPFSGGNHGGAAIEKGGVDAFLVADILDDRSLDELCSLLVGTEVERERPGARQWVDNLSGFVYIGILVGLIYLASTYAG